MATTFNKIYRKVANNGNSNDYQLVSMIGSDGVPVDIMQGATTSSDGVGGLMPVPSDDIVGLLNNRGEYDRDGLKINMTNGLNYVDLSLAPDKSDSIMIPSVVQAVNQGNTLGLMPKETKQELDKLYSSYKLTYDRAKLVYHSWNANADNYNSDDNEGWLNIWEENWDSTGKMINRVDFYNNTYTSSNPFLYPVIEKWSASPKRSAMNNIYTKYNTSVQPVYGSYHSTQSVSKNNVAADVKINKLVFSVSGLYAIYLRYWVRSSSGTSHRRVSFCPIINGETATRYRGQVCTMANCTVFYTQVFFQYFNEDDYLLFGLWPEDTCSSTNYVSLAFSDLCVYAIQWDGKLHLEGR